MWRRPGDDDGAAGADGTDPAHAGMKHDDVMGEAVPEMEELSVREIVMMLVLLQDSSRLLLQRFIHPSHCCWPLFQMQAQHRRLRGRFQTADERVHPAAQVTQVQEEAAGYRLIFPGGQPVSLDRANLGQLQDRHYMVTWKADGTRYMLLLCKWGTYLIDRSFSVRRVQVGVLTIACPVLLRTPWLAPAHGKGPTHYLHAPEATLETYAGRLACIDLPASGIDTAGAGHRAC